jgi:hypothetical protein
MRGPSRALQLVLVMLATIVVTNTSSAQLTMTYSPLTGSPDQASAKIKTEMYCCPPTALLIKAKQPVGQNDLQWVFLGLTVPGSAAGRRITAVEVCYEIKAPPADTAYISQTRLTDMTTPNVATVRLDDATKRTAIGPTCYKTIGTGTTAPFMARGTVTLALRLVLSNTRDEIRLGMVRLYF